MRALSFAIFLLLTACQTSRAAKPKPTPNVPVVVPWPTGQRFVATVTKNLPDRAKWRAVRVWWRQALGQTAHFSLAANGAQTTGNLPTLELTVEPRGQTLVATLHQDKQATRLFAGSFAPDSTTPDLLLALDHLAWCTRLALGEAAEQPRPVAAVTSSRPQVVLAVADAVELLSTGGFVSAHRTLRRARQRDGGSPYVLDRLAAIELLRGDSEAAERICIEALGYPSRLSPTVQHRLARTLLMARSARSPSDAERYDKELARLAQVAQRERPHDEEPMWTRALAHNFAGEFEQARALLEDLLKRQPERAFVPYHLGWACLGLGDAAAAADHLARAALRLPAAWLLLPRAIALYEANRDDELRKLLQSTLDDHGANSRDSIHHQILRMQAAHAILSNDSALARNLLLKDLQWLREHPLALANRVGEFAEEGALLARLGSAKELPALLAAVQRQHAVTAIADACAFIGGMHHVQVTGRRALSLEQTLSRDGDSPWASLLAAFAHERLGEVGDMQNALARAAILSGSPMTKALLAKSLTAVGKHRDAERLQQTLQRELTSIHLRQTCQHPLFGPELAYAYVLR